MPIVAADDRPWLCFAADAEADALGVDEDGVEAGVALLSQVGFARAGTARMGAQSI